MPILYKKINKNMRTIFEMTQKEASDYIRVMNLPVMSGYTKEESNTLVNLVKEFINPDQRNCAQCGTTGDLRQAKDKFIIYYKANLESIQKLSNGVSLKPICQDCLQEECECCKVCNESNCKCVEETVKPVKKRTKK